MYLQLKPQVKQALGNYEAAILLERVKYWFDCVGREFYKFNDACEHIDYKEGDSWQEELVMSRREFERARKSIATRIVSGSSKNDLMATYDKQGNLAPINHIVLYWRDKFNRLWYWFNQDLYDAYFSEEDTPCVTPDCEQLHEMYKNEHHYVMSESEQHIVMPESEQHIVMPENEDTPATKPENEHHYVMSESEQHMVTQYSEQYMNQTRQQTRHQIHDDDDFSEFSLDKKGISEKPLETYQPQRDFLLQKGVKGQALRRLETEPLHNLITAFDIALTNAGSNPVGYALEILKNGIPFKQIQNPMPNKQSQSNPFKDLTWSDFTT